MTKASGGVAIGNPKVSDFSEDITLSEQGNPVTARFYSFDSKLEYDTVGNAFFNVVKNFYHTCKIFKSTIESKEETVKNSNYMTALNHLIYAVENFDLMAKTMRLKATELELHGGKITIDSPEIIMGNDLNIDENPGGENEEEWKGVLENPDTVMTYGKFKMFYKENIQPYMELLRDAVTHFNSHKHTCVAPESQTVSYKTDALANPIPLVDSKYEDGCENAVKTDSLKSSKAIKTY